jgi:hypothetical protein
MSYAPSGSNGDKDGDTKESDKNMISCEICASKRQLIILKQNIGISLDD